jgi:hypothetical protein
MSLDAMKRLAVSLVLLTLISILADGPAYAWGIKDYQIVAYIRGRQWHNSINDHP